MNRLSDQVDDPSSGSEPVTLKRFHKAVRIRRDLLSLGTAGPRVGRMIGDPMLRTSDLVDIALLDPAVVVRLVRAANGFGYQTRDRSDVRSLHRAISLIGQTQVRELVNKLPLVDDFVPKDRRAMVLDELASAAFAATFCRRFLDTRNPVVSDEGAVTAIVASLWRTVCVQHLPHEFAAIKYVKAHTPKLLESIQRELFAHTPLVLNKQIIEAWGLPRAIYEVIAHTDQRPVPVIAGRDWLPIAVSLSLSVVDAIRRDTPDERTRATEDIITKYRHCVDLNQSSLTNFISDSAIEALSAERSLHPPEGSRYLDSLLSPFLNRQNNAELGWTRIMQVDSTGIIARINAIKQKHANTTVDDYDDELSESSGKPADSADRINNWAIQFEDVVNEHAESERSGFYSDDLTGPLERIIERIVPILLNGIQDSFGFDYVAWFDRSEEMNCVPKSMIGLPTNISEQMVGTPLECGRLIDAALRKRVQLYIGDCTVAHIKKELPDWFDTLFVGVNSFLLVPVLVNDAVFGFIVACRRQVTGADDIDEPEFRALLEMRNNVARLIQEHGAVSQQEKEETDFV